MKPEPTKTITLPPILNFPADIRQAAKVSAVTQGKSLKQWVIEAWTAKLEAEKKGGEK